MQNSYVYYYVLAIMAVDLYTYKHFKISSPQWHLASQPTRHITEMASFYIKQMSEADLFISPEQIKLLDTIGQGK